MDGDLDPGVHRGSCAKKACGETEELPGAAKTQTDRKTKTVYALAKAGTVLSPKALWEATEKAEQEPTKPVGPSGTFTAKPKS